MYLSRDLFWLCLIVYTLASHMYCEKVVVMETINCSELLLVIFGSIALDIDVNNSIYGVT